MAQSVKPADGVTVGQVFQGKYRVDAILGQGGMGVVAECTHLALNERVAIKMLRPDVLLDQDAVSRFIREAQAAVKLKSEYVARVSDVGTFENGTPYMVMEFLEGLDLGELLKQRGVLPVQWAVELMLQTAEALAEAHSLSIVHRDVKPTNLFVTWRPDGSALIKVLDFGISKSPMGTDMQLTQTQSLLGTPAYMSPEQMRSARLVDTRTDIWSLGTVFYEILEGRRPFEAESFSEMCVKVAVDPAAPMINTPPPLQQVILRCLAKTPEQRYSSMAEFARDLVPFAADPHAAQMLCDRMARMLRRATPAPQHNDWEGAGTGVGAPKSARDLGSGPVRGAQQQRWGAGSDPAARAWGNPTPPPPASDGSQPFSRPLADQSQPYVRPPSDTNSYGSTLQSRKKNRWPLVVFALLVVAGGAVGVGLAMSGGETKPKVVEPIEDKTEMPTKVEIATPTNVETATPTNAADTATGSNAAGSNVGATNPADTNAGSDAAAQAGSATVEDAKTETKAAVGSPIKKASTGTKKLVKKVETKKTTDAAGSAAQPPVPEKKCDPFDSMHGCNTK